MANLEGPILYRARFLLPITDQPVEDGALLVENGRIRAVGTHRDLVVSHPGATTVDFGDAILLPPMVNAHTHLELSSFAEWAAVVGEPEAPQDFVDWILWLVRVKRSVTVDQRRDALTDGLQASLNAGTGAIGDILTTLDCAAAYCDSPLKGRIFTEILGHDPDLIAQRITAIGDVIQSPPGQSLKWGLSPHAPYTLSSTAMDQAFAFADCQDLQCSVHFAESIDETHLLQHGTGSIAEKLYAAANWPLPVDSNPGSTPVSTFSQHGRLRQGDLLIHGVHVDAEDVGSIQRAGCVVVLCPRSNATLNVGKAPVNAYLKAGVPLSLGTDSLASSSSLSIWDEVAFAYDWFAGEATPRNWLEIATLGGAKALGLQDCIGHLSSGCDASFQVVSLPEAAQLNELEDALCTYGSDVKVSHLYLEGRSVDLL